MAKKESKTVWLAMLMPVVAAGSVVSYFVSSAKPLAPPESTQVLGATSDNTRIEDVEAAEAGLVKAATISLSAELKRLYIDHPISETSVIPLTNDASLAAQNPADAQFVKYISDLLSSELQGSVTSVSLFSDPGTQNFVSIDRPRQQLQINRAAISNIDRFMWQLIASFGELLTASPSQISTDIPPADAVRYCNTFLHSGLCYSEGSMMNRYYEAFWQDQDHFAVQDRTKRAAADMYKARHDDFASAEALVSPTSDLYETLAWYVLEPPLSNESTLAQKVRFIDQLDEMKDLKRHIHSALLHTEKSQ